MQSKNVLTQYELEMTNTYHARRSILLSTTDPGRLTLNCATNMLISSTLSFNKRNDNTSFILNWLNSCFEPDEKQVDNHPIFSQYSHYFHRFTPNLLTILDQNPSTVK